jgi:hypothetical protein
MIVTLLLFSMVFAGCIGGLSDDGGNGLPDAVSCTAHPTAGFTEYSDSFIVQHPWNLDESDRFSFTNNIYSTWIHHDDLPFEKGSPTGPRTEMRWSQGWDSGERMWEADVLVDAPTSHSAVMQVKSNDPGAHEAIYLQVDNGHLQNGVGPTIANNIVGHWFHANVAYNANTRVARVWINNCLVFTRTHPVAATWYFKNGVYGCDPVSCESHFKNVHFWRR